jgi:hypothetical protein
VNERLRVAMTRAQLGIDELSDIAGVDPKTVQRWLGGRLPHARHRWALAKALGQDERSLWPQAEKGIAPGGASTAEVIAAFGHRADVPADGWWEMLTAARSEIDLLGFAMLFLHEQHPRLCDMLRGKAAEGVRIRIALVDPAAAGVADRDDEEGLNGALPARVRTALRYFDPIVDCDGIELNTYDAPLYSSVFRADDDMYVTPHIHATPGYNAPLLHLRRLGADGIFHAFASHFESIWSISSPLGLAA